MLQNARVLPQSFVYSSNQHVKYDLRTKLLKSWANSFRIVFSASIFLPQEFEDSTFPAYTHQDNMFPSDADLYSRLFDQDQTGTALASDSSLTIAQEQKFSIREISPQWGYATESTKVNLLTL